MPADKYNAFISYAWVDNQPFEEGQTGWISTFVDRLRKLLSRELPRELAQIPVWLDYEKLRGSDHISDTIRAKLESSRLLVPILSKGYLESPWCRQELEIFTELHGPDSRRIFPVWMSPTDGLPQVYEELLKYRFWFEDDAKQPRTRWFPDIDPTDREYGLTQQDMARDMAARLGRVLREEQQSAVDATPSEPAPPPSVQASPDTLVLVNGGEEDADLVHEVARRLFQDHGIGATVPFSVLKDKAGLKSSDITRDLRDKLKLCSSVLIVFKEGPAHQIHRQLIEYMKVTPKRPKDRPPLTLDLCRPDGGPLDLGFLPAQMKEHVCGSDCAADCVIAVSKGLP